MAVEKKKGICTKSGHFFDLGGVRLKAVPGASPAVSPRQGSVVRRGDQSETPPEGKD